jgi:hypothetical protein
LSYFVPPNSGHLVPRANDFGALFAMIWVAGQNCNSPVELFQKHDPDQLMRPGCLSEI